MLINSYVSLHEHQQQHIWQERKYRIKVSTSYSNYSKSQPSFSECSDSNKSPWFFFSFFFFSGSGSKTAAAAAGSSGPSCRPPWVTDSNFADRFRPDKTSTVVTQHQQPAQPTPMQNRSSILQAAQQAPEDSGRTPVCGACDKIIR